MKVNRFAGVTATMVFPMIIAGCGGGGSDTSAAKNPPVISTQPANASVLTGATATFAVSATGTGMGYQWQKNGVAIAGATSASYTTPPASSADNGAQYKVVVSNADGDVTSAVAQITLALSTNQQIYENLILAPNAGSFLLHWNLNFSGPEISGTNYAFSDSAVLLASPLTNGPQTAQQSAPQNLTSTLALRAEGPTRILKNGVVLVVPGAQNSSIASYVGSDVRVDSLASDHVTVAFTQIRSDYSFTALTGAVTSSPADFAHWFNSFFSNPAILNTASTYTSGAGYVKYTATNKGDRYNVFDCTTATTDANITPCVSATSLANALTVGLRSNSDATTYHLADGAVSTVGGIPVWVATAPRPQSATLSTTVQNRIYFELNGNVYTGALVKDGVVLGGSNYVSNPAGLTVVDRLTFLPYQVRLNKAAKDSLAAALNI